MFARTPYQHRPGGAFMPSDMRDALVRYASTGGPLGHFLTAVVENNLVEAISRADDANGAALGAIVSYCYNELPGGCWGSPEKVKAWREKMETEPDLRARLVQEVEEQDHKRALRP